MNNKIVVGVVCLVGVGVAGCASDKPKADNNASALPDWVINPVLDGGIVTTECVNNTNHFGIDKSQAIAQGRATLAKEINTRVQAMDKTYGRKVETQSGDSVGGTFETVSKQLTQQALQGSRPFKVDYVTINGKNNLCVELGIKESEVKDLFERIIDASQQNIAPDSKEALYEEFRAQQAQKELESEVSARAAVKPQ